MLINSPPLWGGGGQRPYLMGQWRPLLEIPPLAASDNRQAWGSVLWGQEPVGLRWCPLLGSQAPAALGASSPCL